MTNTLGNQLPGELFLRLTEQDISKVKNRVILFTTVDVDGWPRHAMLSHFEVIAKDQRSLLILTYGSSSSTLNLLKSGKIVLLFVDEMMSYYVRAHCKKISEGEVLGAPNETLFLAEIFEVLEDRLPTASITSGLTFSGYDPGMNEESRIKVRASLFKFARTRMTS